MNGSLLSTDFDLLIYLSYMGVPALLFIQYFVFLYLDNRDMVLSDTSDDFQSFKVKQYLQANMKLPLFYGLMSFSGPPSLGLNWVADGLFSIFTLIVARERLKRINDLDVVAIQTCDSKINSLLRQKFSSEIPEDCEIIYDPLTG